MAKKVQFAAGTKSQSSRKSTSKKRLIKQMNGVLSSLLSKQKTTN